MRNRWLLSALALVAAAGSLRAEAEPKALVVTSSNAAANELLVYDTAGTLLQSVATTGQGGASQNAGGIAADRGVIAVVNFGSQSVSIFERGEGGFGLRDVIPALSQPVSVAFGRNHLYVLGVTTVESHVVSRSGIDPVADGSTALLRADGTAAQVGVVGDRLIVTERGGAIELVNLVGGAVSGEPVAVPLPPDASDTPFGFTTRGENAYVTVAGSDVVVLVKNGTVVAAAATGVPGGAGEHSPCWIALAGPYLFSTNSPSHSISRLVATGRDVVLDDAAAARVEGAPIDVAASGDLLAVIESSPGGGAKVDQFRIDEDGSLVPTASTPIATRANGVVIVSDN